MPCSIRPIDDPSRRRSAPHAGPLDSSEPRRRRPIRPPTPDPRPAIHPPGVRASTLRSGRPADAIDQGGRSSPRYDLQADEPAASGLDLLPTDDRIERPVAALGEHVRLDRTHEPDRCLARESHDPVHAGERRHDLHPLPLAHHGSARSLGRAYARVAIDADDQAVAEAARLFQAPDVTQMEEVEAAIGEDDPLAGAAGPGQSRSEVAKRQDLLASGRRSHASSPVRSKSRRSILKGALIASGTPDIRVFIAKASTSGSAIGPLTSK